MSRIASARLLVASAVGCLGAALAMRGTAADRSLFLWINHTGWSWVPAAWLGGITILGNGLVATMLLAPTLMRSTGVVLAGLYAAPIAALLSRLPKAWVESPRPAAVLDPALIHVNGMLLSGHNSLPSGHATTAFLALAVLLLAEPARRVCWPAALVAVLGGAAVALSRVAVGAHWPSDVLAGAGLGLLAGAAGAALQRRWPLAYPATRPVLALGVLLLAGLLLQADTGYPLARPLQVGAALLGAASAAAALWRCRGAWTLPRLPDR